MKKILALIGAIGLTTTSVATVISCGNNENVANPTNDLSASTIKTELDFTSKINWDMKSEPSNDEIIKAFNKENKNRLVSDLTLSDVTIVDLNHFDATIIANTGDNAKFINQVKVSFIWQNKNVTNLEDDLIIKTLATIPHDHQIGTDDKTIPSAQIVLDAFNKANKYILKTDVSLDNVKVSQINSLAATISSVDGTGLTGSIRLRFFTQVEEDLSKVIQNSFGVLDNMPTNSELLELINKNSTIKLAKQDITIGEIESQKDPKDKKVDLVGRYQVTIKSTPESSIVNGNILSKFEVMTDLSDAISHKNLGELKNPSGWTPYQPILAAINKANPGLAFTDTDIDITDIDVKGHQAVVNVGYADWIKGEPITVYWEQFKSLEDLIENKDIGIFDVKNDQGWPNAETIIEIINNINEFKTNLTGNDVIVGDPELQQKDFGNKKVDLVGRYQVTIKANDESSVVNGNTVINFKTITDLSELILTTDLGELKAPRGYSADEQIVNAINKANPGANLSVDDVVVDTDSINLKTRQVIIKPKVSAWTKGEPITVHWEQTKVLGDLIDKKDIGVFDGKTEADLPKASDILTRINDFYDFDQPLTSDDIEISKIRSWIEESWWGSKTYYDATIKFNPTSKIITSGDPITVTFDIATNRKIFSELIKTLDLTVDKDGNPFYFDVDVSESDIRNQINVLNGTKFYFSDLVIDIDREKNEAIVKIDDPFFNTDYIGDQALTFKFQVKSDLN